MNNIYRELYHLMEDRFGRDFVCSYDYRSITREFNSYMDQVEAATSFEFHEDLYNVIMDYLVLEQNNAFRWGLRLGLQLNTL